MQIKFSHDWNNKVTKSLVFSTIRRRTIEKESYYVKNLNNIFDIVLDEKAIGKAKLINMTIGLKLSEVDESLIMLDVGKQYKDAIKVFKGFGLSLNSEVLILIFERIL